MCYELQAVGCQVFCQAFLSSNPLCGIDEFLGTLGEQDCVPFSRSIPSTPF